MRHAGGAALQVREGQDPDLCEQPGAVRQPVQRPAQGNLRRVEGPFPLKRAGCGGAQKEGRDE